MIGVRMREDDGVEGHGPEVRQARQQPETSEVVRTVGAAPAVHENAALGRDEEPRVSLSDVERLQHDRVSLGDDRPGEDERQPDRCGPGESRAPERGAPRETRDDEQPARGSDQGEGGRRDDPHRVESIEGQEQREQDVREEAQRDDRECRRRR